MTTAPPVILVTDEASAEDLAEAITHLCQYAKRQQHHPDCLRWVMAHAQIDAKLDDWQVKSPPSGAAAVVLGNSCLPSPQTRGPR